MKARNYIPADFRGICCDEVRGITCTKEGRSGVKVVKVRKKKEERDMHSRKHERNVPHQTRNTRKRECIKCKG